MIEASLHRIHLPRGTAVSVRVGVPVAARLLDLLARHDIREVGVLAGHLADQFADIFR